ncbi:MAG: arsenosugar biosynthesis radical SAM protein ArsS [Actinomycetes bacterium]|jgi:radical SAM/Cys-rich protein|nr:arsenosugar biosynthesis radical SAM protein ArsS [Actinomycetes bacterium]
MPSIPAFATRISPQAARTTRPTTMQLNITDCCNLACTHCHRAATATGDRVMSRAVMQAALDLARAADITTIDITGGAPELHPDYPWLLTAAAARFPRVMTRTNLVAVADTDSSKNHNAGECVPHPVEIPGGTDGETLPVLWARLGIVVVASVPCYTRDNFQAQRGTGTYDRALAVLRRLNALGYGDVPGQDAAGDIPLELDLVYNPGGAFLPGDQAALQADYRRELAQLGVRFNHLYTLTNVPLGRFADALGGPDSDDYRRYMRLLADNFNPQAAEHIMCRQQICVAVDGTVYDCDFNSAAGLPARGVDGRGLHVLHDTAAAILASRPIACADYCYACTAGAGSSCTGATVGATGGATAQTEGADDADDTGNADDADDAGGADGAAATFGPDGAARPGGGGGNNVAGALVVLGLVVAAVLCYLLIPALHMRIDIALRVLRSNPSAAAAYLRGFGVAGPVVSAALMVLQSVLAPIPAFVITFANGMIWGFAAGAALSWSSAMVGAALCFWIARLAGRPVVEKLAGGSRALGFADLFFQRYGSRSVLIARLLPFVSFDLISYAAGLTDIGFGKFWLATGLGQLPATLLYSYLASIGGAATSIRVLFYVFVATAVILVLITCLRAPFLRRLQGNRAAGDRDGTIASAPCTRRRR